MFWVNTLIEKSLPSELRKLLVAQNPPWSQNKLAEVLRFRDSSLVSQWMSGKKVPGELYCLRIARLAAPEDRQFWIEQSGLSAEDLAEIADALALPPPSIASGEEIELLDLFRDPEGGIESSLKDLITHTLGERRARKSGK